MLEIRSVLALNRSLLLNLNNLWSRFLKPRKVISFYTESVIPTIIWINCLLSLTRIDHDVYLIMYLLKINPILHSSNFCFSLVPLKFEAASSSWVKNSSKHFRVYFFCVVDFILLSLSLTAVSSGRLDTMGEMLGRVRGRWVGVSGVGCMSVRVDVSGWECYNGDSVANCGDETEQAIDVDENSGWGNETRIPASIASNLASTDVIKWNIRSVLSWRPSTQSLIVFNS